MQDIGVIFPFDFVNIHGGASQRLKADLTALVKTGFKTKLLFPSRVPHSDLNIFEQTDNIELKSYPNFQNFSFLPEKTRLILDQYSQPYNPFVYSSIRKYMEKCKAIFAHYPTGFTAAFRVFGSSKPVYYVAHNFEYGIMRTTARNNLATRIVYNFEQTACSRASGILCVSQNNKDDFISTYHINPEKITVFPNTVDVDYFSNMSRLFDKFEERKKLGIDVKSFVLFFPGRMDYRPNADALHFIIDELVPSIQNSGARFKVLVVGAQIPFKYTRLRNQTIFCFSDVSDIRPYFAAADALIVPLRMGSGTRIKILESFAAGLPVISTSEGCEGIKCVDKEHLFIAKRENSDFLEKCSQLMNDISFRNRLINNARELVKKEYSADMIAQKYVTLINKRA